MKDALVQRFSEVCLEWARVVFTEEIQSDFARAKTFDSPRSQELLAALFRQPSKNIRILSHILPLEVFWDLPHAIELRTGLSNEARVALEAFRADYERACNEHFYEHVSFIRRRDDKRVHRDFRTAARIGNGMVMDIADRWKCGVDGGAPGEWGLIFKRDWGRLTVSFNLSHEMTLSYSISLCDPAFKTIRRRDDFLMALGIGAGAWIVESPETFPHRLSRASDFAWWHLNEYEKIISSVQDEPGPFLTRGH